MSTRVSDLGEVYSDAKEQLEAEDKSHTAQTATLLRAASGPASARRHQLAHAGGPLCQRSRGRRPLGPGHGGPLGLTRGRARAGGLMGMAGLSCIQTMRP